LSGDRISRKKADEKIHGHIRLQTPEELLKRVDTGFGQKARAPFQAIVEGVQNSADAIDKAREAMKISSGADGYEPRIEIVINEVDKSRGELQITIADTGIGIPRSKVPIVVRAGGTGTIEYKASRSQQGIGWKAAAIYSNQSTGKPIEIVTKTYAERAPHRHIYDYGKGKVEKLTEEEYEGEFPPHGTRMSLNLIGDYSRAKSNIKEFIKRMAAIHPYITFVLRENGTLLEYERKTDVGIPIPSPVPPHPNSVDIGELKDMLAYQARIRSIRLSGFLRHYFCRIGKKSIDDLIERVSLLQYFDERGIFAGDIIKRVAQSTKAQSLKKEPEKLRKYMKTLVRDVDINYSYAAKLVSSGKLNPNSNIRALKNDELKKFFKLDSTLSDVFPKPAFTPKTTVGMILNDEAKVRLLVEVLRSMFFPSPPTDSLMPIPKGVLIEGFTSIYNPEKYAYVKRKPTSTKGRPVQVQVLAMYGGEIPDDLKEQERLIRIANCTPLLYEFGSDIITQTARDIDWARYRLGKKGVLPNVPVIFVVHVTSPQLKYLGVAKQAIGADDIIAEEIKFAIQAASRTLGHHVSKLQKSKQSEKARKFLEKHAFVVSETLSKMIGVNRERVYESLVQEIHKRRPVIQEPVENEKETREGTLETFVNGITVGDAE